MLLGDDSILGDDSGTFRDCRRSCTDPWYAAECPAAVSFVAEGSAAVALELEIALRDDRRATFRSLEELDAWTGCASPAGPLEGLLPIEGGESVGTSLRCKLSQAVGLSRSSRKKETLPLLAQSQENWQSNSIQVV